MDASDKLAAIAAAYGKFTPVLKNKKPNVAAT